MTLIKAIHYISKLEDTFLELGNEVLVLCASSISISPTTNATHITWSQETGDYLGLSTQDDITLDIDIGLKLGIFTFYAYVTSEPDINDTIIIKTRPTDYLINLHYESFSYPWEKINNVKIKYVLKQYTERIFKVVPPYSIKVLFSDNDWTPSNLVFEHFVIMSYDINNNTFTPVHTVQPFKNYSLTPDVEPYFINTDASYFMFAKFTINDKVYMSRGPQLNLSNTLQVDYIEPLYMQDTLAMSSKRALFKKSNYIFNEILKPFISTANLASNRGIFSSSSPVFLEVLPNTTKSSLSHSSSRASFSSAVIG